jgi:hypothetical protein
LVAPLAGGTGVELSWQLRSEESSPENGLVFDLPSDASLQMSTRIPGGAEVVSEGSTLYVIPPAAAEAADGSSVPVSYSVKGNVLETHVVLSEEVEYPVLVDPEIVIASSGEADGGSWSYWNSYGTCSGCYEFLQYANLLQVNAPLGPVGGNFGKWSVELGSKPWVGITRAEVSNVTHQPAEQSQLKLGIGESNGSEDYTTNGYGGAIGPAPITDAHAYSGTPMVFCAQGAGGYDGGPQPLCAESYVGRSFYIEDYLLEPRNTSPTG